MCSYICILQPKKQAMLQTEGLGVCLLQEEKPVYFASKALPEAKKGYVAIKIRITCSGLGNGEIPSFFICQSFHSRT